MTRDIISDYYSRLTFVYLSVFCLQDASAGLVAAAMISIVPGMISN